MKAYSDNERRIDPLMSQYQSDFIKNREIEIGQLKAAKLQREEVINLLYDWASFSEPFGFKNLEVLARKGISYMQENKVKNLSRDQIAELNHYLTFKQKQISQSRKHIN